MARGGRCGSCGGELTPGGRYCPHCAAPVFTTTVIDEPAGGTTRTEVVSSRSSTPMLLLGIGVVAAIVLALALSRSGDDAAVEPIDEGAAESTTTTALPSAPTTAEIDPSGTTSTTTRLRAVDVAAVPEELSALQLILVHDDGLAALDLSTGWLSTLSTPGSSVTSNHSIVGTEVGALLIDNATGDIVLWSWETWQPVELDLEGVTGAMQTVGGEVWIQSWNSQTGGSAIIGIDGDGETRVVAESSTWFSLVGRTNGGAYLGSPVGGRTHLLSADGTIGAAYEDLAVAGGHDWLIVLTCDDGLRCQPRLVDVRNQTTSEIAESPLAQFHVIASGDDGRRAVVLRRGGLNLPEAFLLDADDGSWTRLAEELPVRADPFALTFDPLLTHWIEPRNRLLAFHDLTTGTETTIDVPERVSRVLVAPEGWEAPA